LYTLRAILTILGAEDYGIYNVVAGIITILSFLSGSLSGASQRYFSAEIGRNNSEQLKNVFNLNFVIYICIAISVLLIAETIGLWFVNNKLIIPVHRIIAAKAVYQFSIISFLFTIITTPYMAMIMAHEDMNIYANVSIIEVIFKLMMVFFLRFIQFDKLQLYGFIVCINTVFIAIIYISI
jgi:O-antigen/teichoic acid export membrane protein